MTAIQFIEKLISQVTTMKAEQAYKVYLENLNGEEASTYPYFRTKYNNHLKFNSSNTPVVVNTLSEEDNENDINLEIYVEEEYKPLDLDFNIPVIESITELSRSVTNYKDGSSPLPTPPGLFPTGLLFDKVISDRITSEDEFKNYLEKYGEDMPDDMIEMGGFTRKCVDIIAGKAGSGKTTSACVLAVKAKIFMKLEYNVDIKIGFISAEMRESEWAKELIKCELLKELEVDYMLNYVGQNNYEDIFWEAVSDYDICVVDSFPAILGHIRMSPNERRVEKTIINDFIRRILQVVEKRNNNIQLINQCNKDGSYKGGTELPHMLSSLRYVMVEGNKRYMMWEKNRNNGSTIYRKLYFDKTEHEAIIFNEDVYDATYNSVEDKKQTLEELFSSLNAPKLEEELEEMEELPEEQILERGEFQGGGNGYLANRNVLSED
jgi:hypothetical protein